MNTYDPNYIEKLALFQLGVKVVIVDDDEKVFIVKRSDKVTRPHGWDLPGGGVEQGEDPQTAAIREIKEETNLDVQDLCPITSYLDQSGDDELVIIGYTAKANGDVVKLSWEHEEYRWVSMNELVAVDFPLLHSSIVQSYTHSVEQR